MAAHDSCDRPCPERPCAGSNLWSCAKRSPPPHLYFVVSAVFHYLGPAFAVLLFARVDVLGVAWLRIASAALIFAVWRRPWRAFAAQDREGRRLLLAWGAVLARDERLLLHRDRPAAARHGRGDRVPAGHRCSPRSARARRATRSRSLLAVPGVYLLTGVQLDVAPLGLALRVRQRRLFALYIVLADRVAKRDAIGGIDGLAASMLDRGGGR